MITDRADLRHYLESDMPFYRALSGREKFLCSVTCDPLQQIARYVRFLRREEYHRNAGSSVFHNICSLYWSRRKNRLGNMLGFRIPPNCFGPGLMIYHNGEIIVNEKARIGAGCILHGGNCIGNNGKTEDAPVIGDGLDLGIGAKIIGGVRLADSVRVGANAVVTRSFEKSGITLVGIPAEMKQGETIE